MNSNRTFTLFSILLGAVLFTYLIIRGIVVEPIIDELTTFFCYVEYSNFWGVEMYLDANNHLLNSFLASTFYATFGDHFFVTRLPNILSFLLFFYAVFKLSQLLHPIYLRYIFVISMTCIPYVLDYFAYCRGYGMSMAFLMMSVYLFIQVNKSFNWTKFVVMSFLLLLAIYANLNLLITAIFIFTFIFFKEIVLIRTSKDFRPLLVILVTILLFVFALYPALSFAAQLKEIGALYYGNKDGLWLTTGVTLSRNLVFSTSSFIKYSLIIVFLLLLVHLFRLLFSKSLLNSNATPFIYLLFGNIVAIVAMRWLLNVNYPEDRVGMYLIFLLIGAVVFSLQFYKKISWMSGIFLLFPILGYQHFNFRTSVFSPDDRMEKADYDYFRTKISDNETSSIYFTQMNSYIFHVRKNNPTDFVIPAVLSDFSEEIILDKRDTDQEKSPNYKLIKYNALTNFAVFKRKAETNWNLIDSKFSDSPIQTKDIYFNLIDSTNWNKSKEFSKIVIECEVSFATFHKDNAALIVDVVNDLGESKYENFTLHWAVGKNKTFKFRRVIEFDPSKTKSISVYLFNPKELKFSLLSKKIDIYSL